MDIETHGSQCPLQYHFIPCCSWCKSDKHIGCYLPTHDMDSHVRLLLKCMDAWMPSQKQCCYYTKYYRGPLLIKCTCSNNYYYVIAVYTGSWKGLRHSCRELHFPGKAWLVSIWYKTWCYQPYVNICTEIVICSLFLIFLSHTLPIEHASLVSASAGSLAAQPWVYILELNHWVAGWLGSSVG